MNIDVMLHHINIIIDELEQIKVELEKQKSDDDSVTRRNVEGVPVMSVNEIIDLKRDKIQKDMRDIDILQDYRLNLFLKLAEEGLKKDEIMKEMGISRQTFYNYYNALKYKYPEITDKLGIQVRSKSLKQQEADNNLQ